MGGNFVLINIRALQFDNATILVISSVVEKSLFMLRLVESKEISPLHQAELDFSRDDVISAKLIKKEEL